MHNKEGQARGKAWSWELRLSQVSRVSWIATNGKLGIGANVGDERIRARAEVQEQVRKAT